MGLGDQATLALAHRAGRQAHFEPEHEHARAASEPGPNAAASALSKLSTPWSPRPRGKLHRFLEPRGMAALAGVERMERQRGFREKFLEKIRSLYEERVRSAEQANAKLEESSERLLEQERKVLLRQASARRRMPSCKRRTSTKRSPPCSKNLTSEVDLS